MPADPRLTNASASAAADAVVDRIDGGAGAGTIKIYDGTIPTNADTAVGAQVLLATLTFSDPAFGAALWIHQDLGVNPSGTGAISVPPATVDGTGEEIFTATGATTVPAPTVSGTGTHESGHSGTGAISVPAATVVGTGSLELTATGAVTVPVATVSGTGTHEYVLTGTGAITVPAATVDGTGTSVGGIDPGGSGGRKGIVVQRLDDTDDLIASGVF